MELTLHERPHTELNDDDEEDNRETKVANEVIDEEKDIAFEEGREEGMKLGIEQGIERARIENAESLLKMEIGTVEHISQATGIPLEQVMQIKERIEK